MHSLQDKSAHRKWPNGLPWRNQLTAHPGWWDAYYDWELPNAYPNDQSFWHRVIRQSPDYDSWQDTAEQRTSLEASRVKVKENSLMAIDQFVGEVETHCFCAPLMLPR
jgi:hypothetical protein